MSSQAARPAGHLFPLLNRKESDQLLSSSSSSNACPACPLDPDFRGPRSVVSSACRHKRARAAGGVPGDGMGQSWQLLGPERAQAWAYRVCGPWI